MNEVWALLPVKAFENAKSRLSRVLTREQRAALARCMATDVLQVLRGTAGIDRVVIVGQSPDQEALAADFGCEYQPDVPTLDVSENITRATRLLAARGAHTMITLPADLPGITPRDVERAIAQHRGGVTIFRASRDNGTNVLIATPPDCVSFSFGADSARRHAAAARRGGYHVQVLDDLAFDLDIDTPEDLRVFVESNADGESTRFLRDTAAAHPGPPSRMQAACL